MTDRITLISAADLSAKQYYLVQLDSNGKAALASAVTENLLGPIVDGGKASGDPITIAIAGVAEGIAGGTITAATHNWLTTDSAGKVVASTTTKDFIIGIPHMTAASSQIMKFIIAHAVHNV